jgi:diguanylate cyclase (GGDEF)-like protein
MTDNFTKATIPSSDIVSIKQRREKDNDVTGQLDIPDLAIAIDVAEKSKPCLIVLAGLDMGKAVFITDGEFIVGRDPSCDLALQDDGISRRHIKITKLSGNNILVTDLNTTNGTYANGTLVKETVLNPSKKILLGRNTVIKYVIQDAFDLKYQQEMFNSSTRDGLTGIYNRRYLIQKLIGDMSFSRRHRLAFTLLMFDIDHFKKINDTYGHTTGDEVLISIANIVAATIRKEDIFGRYGGEEFAIIAQGTNYEGAHTLAERIRKAVADEPAHAVSETGDMIPVTVSIGTATLAPGAIMDAPKLISITDQNMYQAKESGRNKSVSTEIKSKNGEIGFARIAIPPKKSK